MILNIYLCIFVTQIYKIPLLEGTRERPHIVSPSVADGSGLTDHCEATPFSRQRSLV